MGKDVREVDAVIIGGGLMGMFSALALHDRGLRRIAVLDKGSIGGVASPRAAGMLRRHYHIPLLVEMATLGEEIYASFSKRYGQEIGYTKRGYLLAVAASHAGQTERDVAMQREHGVDIELMTAQQVEREFSEFRGLGDESVYAYERSCAFADPPATTRALASVLREKGVQLVEDEEVLHIELANGRVRGVETRRARWRTDTIVNCAGAWGGTIGTMAGLRLPVKVHRLLQIIEVETSTNTDELRILSHESADFYARAASAHRVLVGGRIPLPEPRDAESMLLVSDTSKAVELRSTYQSMRTAPLGQIVNSWAGIDGDTPDYQPVLGPHAEVEGLFSATGFSGHGFKLAPVVGQLIAEYVTGRALRLSAASALLAARFDRGELLPRGSKQMGA